MKAKHINDGFQWCPHCGKPHDLADRICAATGKELERVLHRPPPARPVAPLVGTVLDGKYRVLRAIGSGGMGTVFEAENLNLRRLVAIKVVGDGSSPEALRRLALEAELVAAIQHPNICDLYEVGQLPHGGPYVVLERLFGETLAMKLRLGRRMSLRAVIDIFDQLLGGLQAAHAAHIIHRDLKPQNVILAERRGLEPIVKIVDFGFAQSLLSSRGGRITRPGKLCGTMPYMSPEQLRGEPLDARSDLFAVGVMLYEMLTSRHPFASSSQGSLVRKIMEDAPRPLRERRPDVPVALEQIVSSAMCKDPSGRPASAQEMQRALESVMATGSISAFDDEEPPSATSPIWIPPSSTG